MIAAVRQVTSPRFIVGVKINTKDRSKEGIDRENECIQLIQDLSDLNTLDFIELSGGGFEDAMFVVQVSNQSKGLFASFAERVQKEVTKTPTSPKIVLTGGFRSKSGMEEALRQGLCDFVGLGRPIILNPSFCQDVISGKETQSTCFPLSVPVFRQILEGALNSLWYQRQLHRLSVGQMPDINLSYSYTLAVTFVSAYVFDWEFKGHQQHTWREKSKTE